MGNKYSRKILIYRSLLKSCIILQAYMYCIKMVNLRILRGEKMRKILNQCTVFLVLVSLPALLSGLATSKSFAGESFKNVSVFEANQMIKEQKNLVILDVRTDVEYAQSHLKDAILIPLMVLDKRLYELKASQSIMIYCYKGNRSKTASEYLASKGFKQVYNMLGGIDSWIEEGYEVVK